MYDYNIYSINLITNNLYNITNEKKPIFFNAHFFDTTYLL